MVPMPGCRPAAAAWTEAYDAWLACFPLADITSAYYAGA
jgi:hypothetical protein